MWLIHAALRRPITILVAVIGVALCSILAITRMPVDIFPRLDLPVIYVAQPYGGMSPAQMEGYLVYYYEYHFLYITGIESVESKSIQNVGLLKLTFHPGTDMSQALAQTISYVDRARAFMPYGTVPPFVMRFDAGSVPVGHHRGICMRDRDRIFGHEFVNQVKAMGIQQVLSAPRSPWQRAYIERLIGSIRRECLDHLIVFNEHTLKRHLSAYTAYYHRTRTHLALQKDCPETRPVQPVERGPIVSIPEVGGLHHRYERRVA